MKIIRFMSDLIAVSLFAIPGLMADSVTANTFNGWHWIAISLFCILIVNIYMINGKGNNMVIKEVSEKERRMIEHLADPGEAPGIISAIKEGKKIIITSGGNDQAEQLLMEYLSEIGAHVIDARACHIVHFRTAKHGLAGRN